MIFKDRIDAAKKLVPKLEKYKNAPDTVIVAIPRGSLEMGYELSKALNLPLDIVVTKKIPAPENEEYAIGSIGPDGKALLNESEVSRYGIPESYLKTIEVQLMKEIKRRYEVYRGDPEPPSFKGKTIILIDDGIATGFTIKAAINYLKTHGVKQVVVAVPVSASDSANEIEGMVDEFICLSVPIMFYAVAQFYEIFPQVSDEEASKFIKMARKNLK